MPGFEVVLVGRVESTLDDPVTEPKQGDEGSPPAWLVFDSRFAEALSDIRSGAALLFLTWLDRADRDVLRVRPRCDPDRPLTGVFSTRSPDRPNPIGLHRVTVLTVDGLRLQVADLEAVPFGNLCRSARRMRRRRRAGLARP